MSSPVTLIGLKKKENVCLPFPDQPKILEKIAMRPAELGENLYHDTPNVLKLRHSNSQGIMATHDEGLAQNHCFKLMHWTSMYLHIC